VVRNRIIAIFSAVVVTAGCTPNGPAVLLHSPAPEFSLLALDGRQVSLSQFKDQVVVLDFWATWCASCRESLPHLQALAANSDLAKRGLVVLAVNEQEDPSTIRTFIDQVHLMLPVVQDTDGAVWRSYGVGVLPVTVVIGRDARVAAIISGGTPETSRQIDGAIIHAMDAHQPNQSSSNQK
jgi:peroxiredoxin